jgi:peptidoglycan hydrolase-like protein with peptidoglycan-binding domain
MHSEGTFSRRTTLRGLGVAGLVAAFGTAIPSTAHAAISGSTMIAVQKSLRGLYYYDGYIDGWQGAMTTTAVKSFQKDRGLVVDGYPGSVTQGELAKVVKQVQSAVGAVADADYGSVTTSAVKRFQGSKGLVADGRAGPKTMAALGVVRISSGAASTVSLQKSLWGLYYYDGLIDGNLATMTTSAIREFQRDRGLVIDGYAGPTTRDELAKVVKQVQSAVGAVADADYGSVTTSAVKRFQGSKGLVVDGRAGAFTMAALGVRRTSGSSEESDSGTVSLQQSLWGLYYYDGDIDGNHGSTTTAAVRGFQTDRALVVDGYAGPITRDELATVVKEVQSAVGVVADGDYGDVTISAVKSFQRSKGLVVDGRAGPATMRALGVQRTAGSYEEPDYSGELVVINQMATGPMSAENCGPTSAVITLYALGRPPAGTYKQAVMNMRAAMQIPAGTWGSDASHIVRGLGSSPYNTPARTVTYAEALAAAEAGRPVILNVNHGVLLGGSPTYGHYVVARGTNSAGDFYVSDPGRASLGIRAYTRTRLVAAARHNRGVIVG